MARQATYDVLSYGRLLRLGIDLGMLLIDTAEEYGMGAAEEVVGAAIAGVREKVFLATKLSSEHCRPEDVGPAAERSLKRLGTDCLDLYQIHWPNSSVPIEETVAAMARLVEQGKVRHLGICNANMGLLVRAHRAAGALGVSAVQAEYNLFDRSPEDELLPFCRQNRISFLAYSPLDRGALCNGSVQRSLIYELASAYGRSPAQIVLRWLVGREAVFAIPHTDSESHLRANAAAGGFDLSLEDAQRLDAICRTERRRIVARSVRVPWKPGDQRLQTREDAVHNRMGFIPSAAELAQGLRAGEPIKPIRVRRLPGEPKAEAAFELLEGKLRYWAWVLAFGEDAEIPALIREA